MVRQQRGFTLIELGIVVAVIAVLATVVLMGKGFIDSSRVTKLHEAMEVVKKGASTIAGMQGGTITTSAAGANELTNMRTRNLIPATGSSVGAGGAWIVSNQDFQITTVQFDSSGNNNAVAITYTTANAPMTADVLAAASKDPGFKNGGTVAGVSCTAQNGATGTSAVACFNL